MSKGQCGHLRHFRRCQHLPVETFSSFTSYLELRRSEFLIGGYVGARASLLSTIPPFVAMTQELVARGDTLRLSAPFCHPEAAGPMTSRDQIWSFCTLVSSRGGGPDDTRRYLTVIRTLLCTLVSSRGGGPDDTRRYLTVIRTLLSSRGGGLPALESWQQHMIRGDTLWLSAPLCHSDTVVSVGKQRPSLVILHT